MATTERVLPKNVECPQCGSVITLDDHERIERKYTCPECGRQVEPPSSEIQIPDPNALSEFKRQITGKSDEELLRIMSRIDDYTPAYLQLVIKELESRKITTEHLNQFLRKSNPSHDAIRSGQQDDLQRMDSVTIFRTAKLWELDMARDALKQSNIPHFCREEDLSGLRTMFSALPTPGVGVVWCIFAPQSEEGRAKEVLTQLPIDLNQQPGFWDFTSHAGTIRGYKIFIWVVLITYGLIILRAIFSKLY